MPEWLRILSIVSLVVAGISAIIIAIDLARGSAQKMWIMDLVWPITALWAGPLAVWAYFRYGRAGSKRAAAEAKRHGAEPPNRRQPMPVVVAKGTSHCGSGCTMGDLVAEWVVLAVPFSLFGHRLFGAWVYDFVLAFAFGILFQYFTIKPMKQLSRGEGIKAALKADALSLTAWQVGMYGWMAIATFVIFKHELHQTRPTFWFMMQLGMIVGFMTAYPVNWWLIRRGVKEKM